MSGVQHLPDDVQVLERQWALEPVGPGRDTNAHQWATLPERDGLECRRCGLTVATTRFPEVRDGTCGEWLL